MTAAAPLRVAAVLDATGGDRRAARASARRLPPRRAGWSRTRSSPAAVTHLFCSRAAGAVHVPERRPREVRLVHVPPHRARHHHRRPRPPSRRRRRRRLFVFPGGPGRRPSSPRASPPAPAARCSRTSSRPSRRGDGLVCRRTAYSGHLTGRLRAAARVPGASRWTRAGHDARVEPPDEHAVQTEAELLEDDVSAPPPAPRDRTAGAAADRRPGDGAVPRRRRPRRREPRRRGTPRRRRRAHGRRLRRHPAGRDERLGRRRTARSASPARARPRPSASSPGPPARRPSSGASSAPASSPPSTPTTTRRSSARPTPSSPATPSPSSRRSPTSIVTSAAWTTSAPATIRIVSPPLRRQIVHFCA